MSFQKLVIMGNIGKIEQRFTADGSSIVNFSVAVNDNYKKKNGEKVEHTEWFNCVSFGKQSEVISQYFQKGSRILIEGTLATRKWTDDTGTTRYNTDVKVSSFRFIDKASDNPQQDSYNRPQQNSAIPPQTDTEKFDAIDDDIPFLQHERFLL